MSQHLPIFQLVPGRIWNHREENRSPQFLHPKEFARDCPRGKLGEQPHVRWPRGLPVFNRSLLFQSFYTHGKAVGGAHRHWGLRADRACLGRVNLIDVVKNRPLNLESFQNVPIFIPWNAPNQSQIAPAGCASLACVQPANGWRWRAYYSPIRGTSAM